MRMPLVPPYSSTTTAMGVCLRCISRMTSTPLCTSGTKRMSRRSAERSGQRAGVGVEQEVLGVEVAGDVVERAAVGEQDARELVGAHEHLRVGARGPGWAGTSRRRVAPSSGAPRAGRSASDALEELAHRLAARGAGRRWPRGIREDLVLAEAALDAARVGRDSDQAQDDARRAPREPEQREERQVRSRAAGWRRRAPCPRSAGWR